MNIFKNETELKIGDETILIRPTFENLAEMESNVGSVTYLSWKFSQGVKKNRDGSVDRDSLNSRETIQALPSLSEITEIIYYNQAEKKFSKEEIFRLIVENKAMQPMMIQVTIYIGKMLTGGGFDEEKLEEKKKPAKTQKKA